MKKSRQLMFFLSRGLLGVILLNGLACRAQNAGSLIIHVAGKQVQVDYQLPTDGDGNGLPDTWEQQYFGYPGVDQSGDPDGDGLTNLQEFQLGTNPNQYDDNTPTLTILSGDNQFALAGQFNTQPIVVTLKNAAGTYPIANTPVTFTVQTGGGQLALISTGMPALSTTLTLTTDAAGTAQVYYQQPTVPDVTSTIQVSAGVAQATVNTTSTAAGPIDSDNNGLFDSWELQYFGHTGLDPDADPDGDGLTNLQELRVGSDPTNAAGSPRALVMPNADALLFTGSGTPVPYLTYADVVTAVEEHVSTGCMAYWSSWPGNLFSTFDTTFAAGVFRINAVPSGGNYIWIGSSINLKSRSTFSIEYSITGTPDVNVVQAILLTGSGEYVDGKGIELYSSETLTFNAIPADGEYFLVLATRGTAASFTITSSDAMTVNPVVALWDDNGTTRQYRRCGNAAELAVDANRDGTIKLASEDASDITSATIPYRFWVNNDVDGIPGYEDESLDLRFPDYTDGYIASRRDLEDFSRLHVYLGGLEDAVTNGQMLVGLKWKEGHTDSPAINIYSAVEVDGGTKYLTDVNVADQQVSQFYPFRRVVPNNDGDNVSVDTGRTFIFSPGFWSGLRDSGGNKFLLFEGCTEGKGHLVLVLLKPDGTEIAERPGVWLDLKNIKSMYERARATTGGPMSPNGIDYTMSLPPDHTGPNDNNIPNPTMGWEPDERGFPFQTDPREDTVNKNYILFVHGWRMSPERATTFAETMFKRLWQRGYKGRFAAFRWPTFYGGPEDDDDNIAGYTTYNDSEFRAWKSGESLKQFVNQLPNGYTRNLTAHSMGNIVAGSAFKFGMSVTNYALLNAAVPAMCYDENPALRQTDWSFATPNDDPDPRTKALAYIGQLKTINANVVNFFLEADSATRGAWNINNTGIGTITYTGFKPQRYNLRTTGYDYDPNEIPEQRVFITFLTAFGRYLIDPNESMAYACRSLTYTVNAEGGRSSGSIDTRVDMNTYGFGTEHSAEWNRKLHETHAFYDQLMTEFRLPTLP